MAEIFYPGDRVRIKFDAFPGCTGWIDTLARGWIGTIEDTIEVCEGDEDNTLYLWIPDAFGWSYAVCPTGREMERIDEAANHDE